MVPNGTGTAMAYIHDGMHVFANEAYLKLFQYGDLVEVLATPFMDMVTPSCRDELKQSLRRCQSTGKSGDAQETLRIDTVALDANKSTFPVQVSLKPTFYEGEHCLQVLVATEQPGANSDNDQLRASVEALIQSCGDASGDPVAHKVTPGTASQDATTVLPARMSSQPARAAPQAIPTLDAIAAALAENSLMLVYQPIMSTTGLAPEFYDIHPQMRGADGSLCTAEQLLDAVGTTPLGLQLDRWVCTHAVTLMGDLYKQDMALPFQLTITAHSLKDASFGEWFKSLLAKSGVAASSVVLNIREVDVIACPVEATALIGSLQNSGIRACISGYTNREAIVSVITGCKVSFVRFDNGISEAESRAMSSLSDLKTLVESLHRNEVKVIAADVTDGEAIDGLWIASVDLVQGAWFQKEAQELHARSLRTHIPVLRDVVQKNISA